MRKRVQYHDESPSLTQQHMKQECDVNSILERYRKTGSITHIRHTPGMYGDFTTFQDFKTNLDTVRDAFTAFEALPAHIRKRFGNDPTNLIEFISNDKNYEEAKSLGLVVTAVPEKQKPTNDDSTTINPTKGDPAATLPAKP